MSEIAYHSEHCQAAKPAVNVKDHHVYHNDPRFTDFSEDEFQAAYENCQEAFWESYAPEVSKHYGYGEIYSEGRSGGWLVVENPPDLESEYPIGDNLAECAAHERKLKEQWEEFVTD